MINSKSQAGLTLLEMLTVLAILAVLGGLAIPAYQETIARSRITSATNLLAGSINYAKSEAVDRQLLVRMRPSGADWEDGWEVVADPGGAAEELLKVYQAPAPSITLTKTNLDDVSFQPSGFRTVGAALGDILVEDSQSAQVRRVCVNVSGSVRTTQGDAC